MPLVKQNITIAAGATSPQILVGTPYEYVGPNTRLVVAAAESTGTYSCSDRDWETRGILLSLITNY